jgi:hypothetical protein
MTRSFWEGFRAGYLRNAWVGFAIAGAFVAGVYLGHYDHPYEECKNMNDVPEDIMECVYILEHQESYR